MIALCVIQFGSDQMKIAVVAFGNFLPDLGSYVNENEKQEVQGPWCSA